MCFLQGWCGWKGPEFWDQNAYYNLCLPQRPKTIWVTCKTLIHSYYSCESMKSQEVSLFNFLMSTKLYSTVKKKKKWFIIYYPLSSLQCFKHPFSVTLKVTMISAMSWIFSQAVNGWYYSFFSHLFFLQPLGYISQYLQ